MPDPNQALQALLQPGQLKNNLFPPTSRYSGIETPTMETTDGRTVIYLRRRFLPSPDKFALLQEHLVTQSERLDNITATYLNDPEQFWRLCDANGAMRPDELTETIGRRLRITLPEGIPGIANAKGINLQLYIGPIVPIQAPKVVMDALTEVSVTINDVGQSGFQLSFTLSNQSPLHTLFLLTGGSPINILRVVIAVIFNGTPQVLMDGVVTNHQILPGTDSRHSTLSITGEDLSVLMDKIDFAGFPFPALPAEGRVALILLKYAVLGIVPVVVPSVLIDIPIPISRIPFQQGTDLAYIKELAAQVGYVFFIEPGPVIGANIAYWGPQIKAGLPQPALNINMDVHTNVESLTFSFNNNLNGIPTVFYYDEITKGVIVVPIPPITPLNPPLGLVPPIPDHLQPISDDLAKRSLPQAIMIGLAKASQWAEAVSGKGELDVVRYGNILKARQLVGVRGAGTAYNGLYYVKSVTHKIKRGEYKQSFELSRNGLISTIPRVVA